MVRIPDQPLHERVLDLSAPLIERLGSEPTPKDVRGAIELGIAFWNAKARASKFWGTPSLKQLDDLRRKMTGKRAAPGDAETFEMLTERWRERALAFDPRLVGEWSLEIPVPGVPRLSCEMRLPDGVEAEILPPIEKRVAIGGKFLDEVRIFLCSKADAIARLSFPVGHHWGAVGDDGSVMVYTKMPTAVSLLAEGVLPPLGGAAVELMVGGRKLDAMLLTEVTSRSWSLCLHPLTLLERTVVQSEHVGSSERV